MIMIVVRSCHDNSMRSKQTTMKNGKYDSCNHLLNLIYFSGQRIRF